MEYGSCSKECSCCNSGFPELQGKGPDEDLQPGLFLLLSHTLNLGIWESGQEDPCEFYTSQD